MQVFAYNFNILIKNSIKHFSVWVKNCIKRMMYILNVANQTTKSQIYLKLKL